MMRAIQEMAIQQLLNFVLCVVGGQKMMIEKLKKDKAKETIASMDKWITEIKKSWR